MIEDAPWAITWRPVSVEPIKVIILGMRLMFSASPSSPAGPAMIFTTPAGSPIRCIISPRYRVASGVWLEGFSTQQQPEAMVGPILRAAFPSG